MIDRSKLILFKWISANKALLMKLANSSERVCKDGFYDLKSSLCERYGVEDGYELQLLPNKECWSCGGTGTFWYDNHRINVSIPRPCSSCNGTGIYKPEARVYLKRYLVDGLLFHKPVRYVPENIKLPVINGYVMKHGHGLADAAHVLLRFRYDWRYLGSRYAADFDKLLIYRYAIETNNFKAAKMRYYRRVYKKGMNHRVNVVVDNSELPF